MREITWELLKEMEEVVRRCGDIMLQADRKNAEIHEKSGSADFVTKYDKNIQQILKKELLQILPEAVFVGEEEELHAGIQEGLAFIVDPIDGTTNFIKDYHVSCISVGIARNAKPYAGIIFNPYLNEMYTAIQGKGAFRNGEAIHVSSNPLKNGIVVFGSALYYPELSRKSFDLLYDLFQKSLDIRRSGSAAYDLCCIACGRAELFFELRLSPWDYAAGASILQEAGGKITTVEGEEISLERPCSILATNGIATMN